MQYWLTTAPLAELRDPPITMVQYWKEQPDSMLKRVALRAGAFLISQCATERANKIPKEVWTHDCMRTVSMARDVFVNTNLDYFPEPVLKWDNVGHGRKDQKDAKRKHEEVREDDE